MTSVSITASFGKGLSAVWRNRGLVVLLYLINLTVAALVSLPVYRALKSGISDSGFGPDLARQPDIVVLADVLEKVGSVLGAVGFQLIWMVPLMLLWKVALSVGLINALRQDGVGSFWEGVGRFTLRGLLLAILFFGLGAVVVGGIGAVAGAVVATGGEKSQLITGLIVLPISVVAVFSLCDLLHDYARIAMVTRDQGVFAAFAEGVKWPFVHLKAIPLYAGWWVVGLLVILAPIVTDRWLDGSTSGAIWGLFLLQQVLLIVRAGVTVGWFGSEVHLYEETGWAEAPLIAEADAAPAWEPVG